jgi:argininosuccinate synthase
MLTYVIRTTGFIAVQAIRLKKYGEAKAEKGERL